jgi:lysophospholipase L1-like esterase
MGLTYLLATTAPGLRVLRLHRSRGSRPSPGGTGRGAAAAVLVNLVSAMHQIRSFVALGDSFTEGIGDPYPDGRGDRGWADRFAGCLAADLAPGPELQYANLAVRGKTLGGVVSDQLPAALAMAPTLVSLAAGGNDLLRRKADPDALGEVLDAAVGQLSRAGIAVLLFAGFDPGTFPVIRLIRGRAAVLNAHIRVTAQRYDCHLVDLWQMRVLRDPREWSPDRLHMGPDGHRRVALRACEVMGVPADGDWRQPMPPGPAATALAARAGRLLAARRQDARWAREHAAPWVSRRLRGISSGDGATPKRPQLLPVPTTPSAPPGLPLATDPLDPIGTPGAP